MFTSRIKLTPVVFVGLLAVLAPIGYLGGRFTLPVSPENYLGWVTSGFVAGCLGAMVGIPIGLFFGSLRPNRNPQTSTNPARQELKADTLNGLHNELNENKALFEARKGSATVVARLGYVTTFWDIAKSSGSLEGARLMNAVGLAYYWLEQANHLERLAYDAKNSGVVTDSQFVTAKLISEVRLLDSSIEAALASAIDATASAR